MPCASCTTHHNLQISEETGLPQNMLVVTDGHDHLCGALAAGVTHPGQLLDSTGTACAILALSQTFQPTPAMLAAGCPSYSYVLPDIYVNPELVRAVMEGPGFWLRNNLEVLHILGIAASLPAMIAIGGARGASELMQIKAEVTGCRIRVPRITEAAATGAALLAGIGAGLFSSGTEAATAVRHTETLYEPGEAAQAAYDDIYHRAYLPTRNCIFSS